MTDHDALQARLDRARCLALSVLGNVLTDDRTTPDRLADYEAALEEIARTCDTTPAPSPLVTRLRAAMKEEER